MTSFLLGEVGWHCNKGLLHSPPFLSHITPYHIGLYLVESHRVKEIYSQGLTTLEGTRLSGRRIANRGNADNGKETCGCGEVHVDKPCKLNSNVVGINS